MKKIAIIISMLMIMSTIVFAQPLPSDTKDMISKLSNPAIVAQYMQSQNSMQFLFEPGNNMYIKRSSGMTESYTFVKGSSGVYLKRGRTLKPGLEVYGTETAINSILTTTAGQACLVQDYMDKGEFAVKGPGAWKINMFIRLTCSMQKKQGQIPAPKPPACDNQKLGDHCGQDSCGAGTTGRCMTGLQCNLYTNRCVTVMLPQPQLQDDGERCSSGSQCKSGNCRFNGQGYVCTAAGKKATGEICQHGGECETGWCLYVGGQGASRLFRCSCHGTTYQIGEWPQPQCQMPTPTGTGKEVGEPCAHGGQCRTGNCIYVTGQGASRLFKCSCDPYRFVTTGC